jgi:dTMP kinase
VLDAEEQVDPLAELLLYAADRAQHVRTLIRPALESGHIVLSDRYADATAAYQGAGRGFPDELVSELVALATGGLMPDMTIVFDLTVDESLRRAAHRKGSGASRTSSTPKTPPSTRASATRTYASPTPSPSASTSSTRAAPSKRRTPKSCASSCRL